MVVRSHTAAQAGGAPLGMARPSGGRMSEQNECLTGVLRP